MRSRRKVRRRSHPYATAEGALDECAVKLSENEEYHPGRTSFFIEQDLRDPQSLKIFMQLRIDRERIKSRTGLGQDKVRLLVVEEHPSYRCNQIRGNWPLTEAPEVLSLNIDREGYSERAFDLRVACSALGGELATIGPDALPRHATIVAKTFSFKAPTSKSIFPVLNTPFSERGWNPEALWYCEFHDLDSYADSGPEALLTVHLNKDLVGLQQLWAPSAARRPSRRTTASMVRSLIVGQVLAEIVLAILRRHHQRTVLAEERVDEEEGSLLHLIRESLSRRIGTPFDHLLNDSFTDPGKISRQIQDMVQMGKRFDFEAIQALDHAASEVNR